MERFTYRKNGRIVIPDIPTPIPLSWCTKKYRSLYKECEHQYREMARTLEAYENVAEKKCKLLENILNSCNYPFENVKEVTQEEWIKLDNVMESFDKSNKDYDLNAMPLLALILRDLLSTPFEYKRNEILLRYVPCFVAGPRWNRLLEKYGLK